jgi:hypothetical protein
MEIPQRILNHFQLDGSEKGNLEVRCPYHDDTNASASLNLEMGLFNCFSCGKGANMAQLDEHLSTDGHGGEKAVVTGTKSRRDGFYVEPVVVAEAVAQLEAKKKVVIQRSMSADEFLKSRGLEDYDPIFDHYVEDGYFWFTKRVGRNLFPETETRPRYKNAPGAKGLFWVNESEAGPVWLTEGVIDGMTLHHLVGDFAVAAVLGTSMTDAQAYQLRDRTVFIVADLDHAGYVGARKAVEKLSEFGANGIILPDIPAGKDINALWCDAPDDLRTWVKKVKAEFSVSDLAYTERLFSGEMDDLPTMSTGIKKWDDILGGGFRPGLHVVGAETGVGKSSLVTSIAVQQAYEGKNVLLISYELSKRQQWARIAAIHSNHNWRNIEAVPELLSDEDRVWVERVAKNLRVVNGWALPKIKYAVEGGVDLVVADYIQRMPGQFRANETRQNVDYNLGEMSNLARDHEMVIIAVSSMNRAAYGTSQVDRKDFKESGSIEFVSQSLTGLRRESGADLIYGVVVKNTRGGEGDFFMKADLAHQRFEDADAPWERAKQKRGATDDFTEAANRLGS